MVKTYKRSFILYKHQRKPKRQSYIDNPEKLTTRGTQDEDKQNKTKTHCLTSEDTSPLPYPYPYFYNYHLKLNTNATEQKTRACKLVDSKGLTAIKYIQ